MGQAISGRRVTKRETFKTQGYTPPVRRRFQPAPQFVSLQTDKRYAPYYIGCTEPDQMPILTDDQGRPVVYAHSRNYLKPGEVAYIIR
jgi:hypothetical protein